MEKWRSPPVERCCFDMDVVAGVAGDVAQCCDVSAADIGAVGTVTTDVADVPWQHAYCPACSIQLERHCPGCELRSSRSTLSRPVSDRQTARSHSVDYWTVS